MVSMATEPWLLRIRRSHVVRLAHEYVRKIFDFYIFNDDSEFAKIFLSFLQVWFKNRRAKYRRSRESPGRLDQKGFFGRDKASPNEFIRSFGKPGGLFSHPYQSASSFPSWKYPSVDHPSTYSSSFEDSIYRNHGNNNYSSSLPFDYSSYSSQRQQSSYYPQTFYNSPTHAPQDYLSANGGHSTASSSTTGSSLSYSQDKSSELNLPSFQWSGYMGANMWINCTIGR